MAAQAERPRQAAAHRRLDAMLAEARGLESAPGIDARDADLRALPLVLYGAGPLARMTLSLLRRAGLTPVAVADGNPGRWGADFEGYRISSPADAVRRFASSARFIVTIYNGSTLRRELSRMGCTAVAHFADLYFEHPAHFLPYCGLASRSTILDSREAVLHAATLWSDEQSAREYLDQIAWRLRLGDAALAPADPPADCYFPRGIYRYLDDELLFDCGAFDGDSIRQFLARRGAGGRPRIVAFEPDVDTYARLGQFVASLSPESVGTVRIERCAVAERSGEVRFAALGSVRSGVDDSADTRVRAIAIDDLDDRPSLIKMDVEGFELPALKGAARTIARHAPVLAISLYHHASDLWTIPAYLEAAAPGHRLFLRRYAEDCWELVLYAVPLGRLAQEDAPSDPTRAGT
ncbi:MAG TPA: FkbM family methyltransferase [Steroidobacteraceae bacterium]|jgi:FkbM family methyltransferase|nr:FkbM family methyltransferase [Steroidobacteraceae bacterium]